MHTRSSNRTPVQIWFNYVMFNVRLEVLEGSVVEWTVMVTVPVLGATAGAVNCVTMPVTPG